MRLRISLAPVHPTRPPKYTPTEASAAPSTWSHTVQVFVPEARDAIEDHNHDHFSWTDIPILRAAKVIVILTTGWPMYLAANVSGRHYDRLANHFDPYSPIYSKRERSEILISDCALAAVVYGLYLLGSAAGWAWLVKVRPSSASAAAS